MDQTEEPCNDFYNFVCGNWLNKAIIPETRRDWSFFAADDLEVDHKIHQAILKLHLTANKSLSDRLVSDFFYSN